jgi:DNA polymerase III subunit gamma/tau
MEFQVSARKWRPQKFSELVGQEPIVRTLKNAIQLDRIAHAYLFSGTRGVGKTTLARIFAKTLNCLDLKDGEPCDECTHCIEIKSGTCLDVREIDGASNNGVGEIRELIENIQYSSGSCRYKVYIIDEIHMLSKSAFNALLKTLEEPPPFTQFLFATTELIKIPETILSRCQCFEFKPLSHPQIIRQLELICEKDGIKIDTLGLEAIAKNGFGSMRDAQSLLDQTIAYCGKEIERSAVEDALGIVGQQDLERFVDNLGNPSALIDQIQETAGKGKDLILFCRDLAEYFRDLAFVKISKHPDKILTGDIASLKLQAEKLNDDELHQFFIILSRTEAEMRRSSMSQMIFEMAVLRLTDVRPYQKIEDLIQTINKMEADTSPASLPTPTASPPPPAPVADRVREETVPEKKNTTDSPEKSEPIEKSAPPVTAQGNLDPAEYWPKIKQEICGRKPFFESMLAHCDLLKLGANEIHLQFQDDFTKELIEEEEKLKAITAGVKAVCGFEPVNIKLSTGKNKAPSPAPMTNLQDNAEQDEYNKGKQKTENEIIQDALEIYGGVVKR